MDYNNMDIEDMGAATNNYEIDNTEESIVYTENIGSGYGWILVLIGLAILSIVFYIYVWDVG